MDGRPWSVGHNTHDDGDQALRHDVPLRNERSEHSGHGLEYNRSPLASTLGTDRLPGCPNLDNGRRRDRESSGKCRTEEVDCKAKRSEVPVLYEIPDSEHVGPS